MDLLVFRLMFVGGLIGAIGSLILLAHHVTKRPVVQTPQYVSSDDFRRELREMRAYLRSQSEDPVIYDDGELKIWVLEIPETDSRMWN